MPATADFADDYFCMPPLDIYCAVAADDNIRRLAERLEDDCHQVWLSRRPTMAYAEICAWAPDVLLIDASTPEGIALARRVRAQFGIDIVLIGLHDRHAPPPAGLFCELLPKPARYLDLARLLGLVPELAHHDDLAFDPSPGRVSTALAPAHLQ